MDWSGNTCLIGKCKQMQFIRANPSTGIQDGIAKSALRPTICGKEIRSFYETLLAEPSTSVVVPDITMTVKLEKIKNSNQHPWKFTKLSNKISKRHDDTARNCEQFFKNAANGNMQGIMDYCEKGMDSNVSDQYGWTALMCASYAGHLNIVKYLLSMGVDISKRSKSGETAADFALKCGHHEIYRYIFSYKKEKSEVTSESSLRKIRESGKLVKSTRFCDACQCTYVGEAHLSSVVHLLETRKPVLDQGYGIPEWNKGYRILRRSGWNEFEGLGRDATGRRYPIKTMLKRDKLGLGFATFDARKVTHFKTSDVNTGNLGLATREKEMKDHRKRILHEKIFERRFRSMFRDE